MAALEYADVPGYSAVLFRRTYPDLTKAGALMDRAHAWLKGTGAAWNEQKKLYTFPSGAKLGFGHLESELDKYKHQGAEYQFIGFDEVSQILESCYRYLFSRLRRLKGVDIPLRVRCASNPGGVGAHWVKQRFIPKGFSPLDALDAKVWYKDGTNARGKTITRAFVPARLKDNPFLDQEEYIESLGELDEVTLAQLLEGDWSAEERGNIFPAWNEAVHVITWSQFSSAMGCGPEIPAPWARAMGQDWGFTEGHPCCTSWLATSPANSSLPGKVFLYRSLTAWEQTADEITEKIKELENWGKKNSEQKLIHFRRMSHEAASERKVYNAKFGLNIAAWKADANGGISQIRHVLRSNRKRPHPFKADVLGPDGYYVLGEPNFYVIVADEQYDDPQDDSGHYRFRMEMPVYHYVDEQPNIATGQKKVVPFKYLDDQIDSIRGIAVAWFPAVLPKSESEIIEAMLPAGLREVAINQMPLTSAQRTMQQLMREIALEELKEQRRRERTSKSELDNFIGDHSNWEHWS